MRRAGQARCLSHLCHVQGAGQTSETADIRLDNINRAAPLLLRWANVVISPLQTAR